MEKLCKVLEMELQTYTPGLHYIQHNLIRQRPGLNKDQITILKSLVINYFILKYRQTF